MTRKTLLAIGGLLVAGLVLASASGCRRVRLEDMAGAATLDKRVELQGAQAVQARVEMGAGTLKLASGATSGTAMQGAFSTAAAYREPRVDYSVEGTTGALHITQENLELNIDPVRFARNRNDWDLRMPTDVPLDLNVAVGAGESKFNLGDLDVRKLDLQVGAGEVTVDLVGPRTHDLDARIESGVGALKVFVPSKVGVIVEGGEDGLGQFSTPGLRSIGHGAYANDQYGKSPVTMRLHLVRGVGEVRVESSPSFTF